MKRINFMMLGILFVTLVATSIPASANYSRHHHFESAAEALELWGDPQGASYIRQLGYSAPVVPPALSSQARAAWPGYAAKYDQYRARVKQAIESPRHSEADQWRVDRAEAALHLVAYEMEQGAGRNGGSYRLIQDYIYDAWWALNHHIATELIEPRSAAPTADVGVNPSQIQQGQTATVTWSTTNADRARLNNQPVSLSGQRTVSPSTNTTYELVATGRGGTATDQTRLIIVAPTPMAPSASITVTPGEINSGSLATLRWSTSNASEASINGERVALSGQRTVSPNATTVYELEARGSGGRAVDQAVLVVRALNPSANISVSPSSVERGSGATLTWTTANATRAVINGENVNLSGNRTVSPSVTTTYMLEATGSGGRATDQTTLIITEPARAPTAQLNIWPDRISVGECATLTWVSTNATEVTINGQRVALSGNMEVCPSTTTTYRIVATGPGGRATESRVLTVTAAPIQTQYMIHFDFDKAFVRETAQDTMARVANMLRENPDMRMRVEGHTDWIGADAYNQALGLRRAQSARDYLINVYAADPNRFEIVSFGEQQPIAQNAHSDGTDHPAGRQMNRRAVFVPLR